MIKKIAATLFTIVHCYFGNAQLVINSETPLPRQYFKMGYGIGNTFKNVDNSYNLEQKDFVGPIYLSYQFNFNVNLSAEIQVSYSVNRFKSYDRYANYYNPNNQNLKTKGVYQGMYGALRINYIAIKKAKIQPYAGFGLGFLQSRAKYDFAEPIYNGYQLTGNYNIVEKDWRKLIMIPELIAGVNVIIKNGWGFYAEVGLGETVLQLGLVKCIGKNIP